MSGCGCGCGCSSNVSYGRNRSCSKQYAGIYFCKDPLCYVKTSFVTPADNVVIEIEVTDSSRLYVGQGIQIGTGYFQITDIADVNNISIAQNGTAPVALTIVAVQPTYGCYQYPILFVGAIDLLIDPTVAGVNSSFVEVASSLVSPTDQLTYSYESPTKVSLEFQMDCTIANTPRYVQVDLPVAVEVGAPEATFAAIIDNGAGYVPAIAYRRSDTLVIALNAATNLSNGASKFRVSGTYDLQ